MNPEQIVQRHNRKPKEELITKRSFADSKKKSFPIIFVTISARLKAMAYPRIHENIAVKMIS